MSGVKKLVTDIVPVAGRQPQKAVAIIDRGRAGIEGSVAGDRDQIAVGIDARTASRLPEAALAAVGRGVVHHLLRQ